jgi:hypothetical protein
MVILVLSILAFLFFHYFEIIQFKTAISPSREYYDNNYFTLERWFNEAGIPVKYNWYDLYNETDEIIKQKTILFSYTEYVYTKKSKEEMMNLIKNHNVIICLDNGSNTLNNNMIELLSDFGITTGLTPHYYTYSDDYTPDYHWKYKFEIEDNKDYILYYDIHNNIRIVRIPLDGVMLTIIGSPSFMWNRSITKELNARLTWELLGEPSDENGIIIVHDYREPHINKSLFGTLMQRGNIIPVLISVILLIFFGFWMVIPVFGLVKEEKQLNTRPIKERFAAEIGFLKKYKGLYYYDEEIKKIKGENNGKNSGKT